jgi:hypothetical protein
MAVSLEQQICSELASLRSWREQTRSETATVAAHRRIDALLDAWQAERAALAAAEPAHA